MENNQKSLLFAENYIKNNIGTISKISKKPTYHFSSPIGWINDPNGFIYFNDTFHLFYQFNPYSTNWDYPFWGHLTSKDLFKFNDCPLAIAPDTEYDKYGCFSGCSVFDNDTLHLFYTGNSEYKGKPIQYQCLASSTDNNFDKFLKNSHNPVISPSKLFSGVSEKDFRDPYIVKYNGKYLCFIATNHSSKPLIAVYESLDLINWKKTKSIIGTKDMGVTFECPNVIFLKNNKVLLVFCGCGVNMQKFSCSTDCQVFYSIISFNDKEIELKNSNTFLVDYGLDYYAPQTICLNNQIINIAWMNSMNHSNIYNSLKLGWAGIFSIPREFKINENGRLIQLPYKGIEKYIKKGLSKKYDIGPLKDTVLDVITSTSSVINIAFENIPNQKMLFNFFENDENSFKIFFDNASNSITLDRTKCPYKFLDDSKKTNCNVRIIILPSKLNLISLRIYIDVSTIEIFYNNGELVMSSLVFNDSKSLKYSANCLIPQKIEVLCSKIQM